VLITRLPSVLDNAQEKVLAEKLAKETENVKSVKNELTIEKK
jgi:osmotically-inducible protein OsmY